MKIFNWIRCYFDRVLSRFRKKKQEQKLRDRIVRTKGISREEIQTNIEEKVNQGNSLTSIEILELAKNQTETDLQEFIAQTVKIRKRVFDLVEIEQEVTALNKKLIEVQIKQKQIEPVYFPQNYKTNKDIEALEQTLQQHNNKQNLVLSTSAIDNLKSRFGQIDKFFQEKILIRVYRIREEKKKKEEETKKQQVKELIGRTEDLINQGNLEEVQNHLVKAASSIAGLRNPEQKKTFRGKIEKLNSKFKDIQIREEAKRQAEDLKKQQEEAEQRRLAEKAKKDEERKFKEENEIIEDNPDKNSKVASFGVLCLYHMTDVSNLNNIFNFGLLSHTEAHKKRLVQRDISDKEVNDRRNLREPKNNRKIHDYVPLYFNPRNPMLYKRKDWQDSIVILEIDYRLIYQKNSLFTNGNAASNPTRFFNDISNLDKVDLSFVLNNGYWTDYPDGKRKKCAEVLVYPIIQRHYIKKVHCKNTQTMDKVRNIARNCNLEVSCHLTSKLYFS